MSRLEELIQQHCPDGVEYKKLGEICYLSRGKVYSKSYIEENAGEYPVYSSQTANNGELGRISTYDYDGEYLTWTTDGAYAGTIFYRNGKFSITNVCGLISIKGDNLLIKFLFYWLSIKAPDYVYRGMGNPKLMSNQMEPIKVPIPPLPVQEEIVRILDTFTELQAELQAELQKRLQQYEYYRDKLLSFSDLSDWGGQEVSVEWKKLGDVADFMNGKGHEKSIVEKGKYIVVNSKFISTQGCVRKYSDEQISPLFIGDVLMVMSDLPNGRALAKCFIVDKDNLYTLNQRICSLKVKNQKELSAKYLFYITNRNRQLLRFDNGVDQTNLRKDDILNIVIPVPPITEQQRIVDILDRFDTLTNDLSQGLPAEIEARRKQYEYYRDQLLTFKQKA